MDERISPGAGKPVAALSTPRGSGAGCSCCIWRVQ
jgi:hypothetical protein